MYFAFALAIAASSASLVASSPLDVEPLHLLIRASSSEQGSPLVVGGIAPSTAPSGNYAPSIHQTCPKNLVRQPTQNSSTGIMFEGERAWVQARRANVVPAWQSYISNSALDLTGFDVSAFLANTTNLPNIGLASSGGGYHAMLHAAALFNAFDARNSSSVEQGTGGILQVATYMTGLSGGSWFTGSLAINNFPSVYELRNIWNLSTNLIRPGGFNDVLSYYGDPQDEINEKNNAGAFDLSLTDYWGAALSRHLINATNNGAATLFSSIQNLTSFSQHQTPMPIVIFDSRRQGETIIPSNTTIYEFTPFEFGTWNPSLVALILMEYLGTQVNNGTVDATNGCVRGYDNAGKGLGLIERFVMGTSATLFNDGFVELMTGNSSLSDLLSGFLTHILGRDNDVATYPNPFGSLNPSTFSNYNETEIDLVNGAEDAENIPL